MPLTGRVFRIQNAKALAPIILGIPPLFGFVPFSDVTVTAVFTANLGLIQLTFTSSANTAADGSYSIPSDLPSGLSGLPWQASLTVTASMPLYRCAPIPLQEATSGALNLWLFPDLLPTTDGVRAGSISSLLTSDASLLAGASITSTPTGLHFSGISDPGVGGWPNQVHIDFTVTLTPDMSTNLQNFLDPSITSPVINIDFPTSVVESNSDVLKQLQSAVAGAGASMNATVLSLMESILETQDNISAAAAQKFFTEQVSVTFMNVLFPTNHTWGIGDTGDKTVVIAGNPCIGFPRILTPGEPVL
jgi:hypothetical protein